MFESLNDCSAEEDKKKHNYMYDGPLPDLCMEWHDITLSTRDLAEQAFTDPWD